LLTDTIVVSDRREVVATTILCLPVFPGTPHPCAFHLSAVCTPTKYSAQIACFVLDLVLTACGLPPKIAMFPYVSM